MDSDELERLIEKDLEELSDEDGDEDFDLQEFGQRLRESLISRKTSNASDFGEELRALLKNSDAADGFIRGIEESLHGVLSAETSGPSTNSDLTNPAINLTGTPERSESSTKLSGSVIDIGDVFLDPEQDREIIETVRDIMTTMIEAVEFVVPTAYTGPREEAKHIAIDLDCLPKLIGDDGDLEAVMQSTTVAAAASVPSTRVIEGQLEADQRAAEAQREFEEQAAALRQEAEEAERVAAESRRRATERKARAEVERQQARRERRAVRIQSAWRGLLARRRFANFLLPVYRREQEEKARREEAARNAARDKETQVELQREANERLLMAREEQMIRVVILREKEIEQEKIERKKKEAEAAACRERRERELEVVRARVEQRRINLAAKRVTKCIKLIVLEKRSRKELEAAAAAKATEEELRVKEAAAAAAAAVALEESQRRRPTVSGDSNIPTAAGGGGGGAVAVAVAAQSKPPISRGKLKTSGLNKALPSGSAAVAGWGGRVGPATKSARSINSIAGGEDALDDDDNDGDDDDAQHPDFISAAGGGDGNKSRNSDGTVAARALQEFDLFEADSDDDDEFYIDDEDDGGNYCDGGYDRDCSLAEAKKNDAAKAAEERFRRKVLAPAASSGSIGARTSAAAASSSGSHGSSSNDHPRFVQHSEDGFIRFSSTASTSITAAAGGAAGGGSGEDSVSSFSAQGMRRQEQQQELSDLVQSVLSDSLKELKFVSNHSSTNADDDILQLRLQGKASETTTASSITGASASAHDGAMEDEFSSSPLLQALRDWRVWFYPICESLSAAGSTAAASSSCGASGTMAGSSSNVHCNGGMDRSASSCSAAPATAAATIDTTAGAINSMILPEDKAELSNFGLLTTTPDSIKEVTLNVESITSCKFLRGLSQLRQLQVNVNKMKNLDGLQGMGNLEELSAKDNVLTDISTIRALPVLKTLRLDTNQLSAAGLETISGLSSLLTLTASSNRLSYLPCLKHCSKLQRLEVYHNSIMDVSKESLAALKCLTHLDLGRNKLQQISGDALSHCPLLQTLVLSQNQITEAPSPLYLPCLKVLWLSGNRLQSLQNWTAPSPPPVNNNNNTTTSSSYDSSSSSSGSSNGTNIIAGSTSRTAAANNTAKGGVSGTSGNSYSYTRWPVFLPLLEKLYLQDNSITTLNARVFATSPLLSELDISFNNITAISDMEGIRGSALLRRLQLHDNPIFMSSELREGATVQSATVHLKPWLEEVCPLLNSVSGTQLQSSSKPQLPTAFTSVNDAGLRIASTSSSSSTSSAAVAAGTAATGGGSRESSTNQHPTKEQVARMLSAFRKNGGMWGSTGIHDVADVEQIQKLRQAISTGPGISAASQLKEQSSSRLDATDNDNNNSNNNNNLSRQFIQLLMGLNTDTNSLRMREKVEQRSPSGAETSSTSTTSSSSTGGNKSGGETKPAAVLTAANQAVSSDSLGGNQEESYWEYASVHQSQRHLNCLLRWKNNIRRGQEKEGGEECGLYKPVQLVDGLTARDDDSLFIVRYQTRSAMMSSVEKSGQSLASLLASASGSVGAAAGAAGSGISAAAAAAQKNNHDPKVLYATAAILIQAYLRGCRVRRQLKGLLSSAKYQDDELDDLFGMDGVGGDEFDFDDYKDYDEYLQPMKLKNNWSSTSTAGASGTGITSDPTAAYDGHKGDNGSYHHHMVHKSNSSADLSPGTKSGDDESAGGVLATSTTSLVYGDHRRRRSVHQSEHMSAIDSNGNGHSTTTADASAHRLVLGMGGGVVGSSSSAPSTASAAATTGFVSPRPTAADAYNHHHDHQGTPSSVLSRPSSSMTEDSGMVSQLSARSGHSRQEQMANEWGITDPKVLAAIAKRNKKMKSLQNAKEARERDKDPEVRYQRFLKNSFGASAIAVAGTSTVRGGAGGGGGGGGRGRGGTGSGRGGRGGAKARKAIPAWMLGQQDEEQGNDED